MKVAQVNFMDTIGGAARAAYRIHHALRRHGVDSQMYVSRASAGDWTVQIPDAGWMNRLRKLRLPLADLLTNTLNTENRTLHSPAILPSHWPKRLNKFDVDIVHLHWVAAEMMSIADIGRLRGPAVWTLHD